jgi:SAM-dependent methyltransferase
MQSLDHVDNNAWYREIASGWARRMITGDSPGVWAQNTQSEVQFAVTQLHLRPGNQVLDLGCGWGRHSLELAAFGLRVTGLDLSRDLLRLARFSARRFNLPVDWVEADLANAPLRGPFDAIAQFCGNFMTWFASSEETLDVLWHMANLLRPGGRLLFGTDDWQPELPQRAQQWDEWDGGAAIYRQRFDRRQRIAHSQTVIFGPEHQRREYRRQTWWPSPCDMERLFAQAGLTVTGKFNSFAHDGYDPREGGLVYVVQREDE